MTERRPYRREPEERRREDLILAALELVAEGGLQAATVRAIADKAGVTPGLIRHYFSSKEDLTRAAYLRVMEQMTRQTAAALIDPSKSADIQLARFVAASVSAPVVNSTTLGLWAAFLHGARTDPEMRAIHAQGYLGFRDLLQSLIAAICPDQSQETLRKKAIACNAVIDGLWMESSMLPEAFALGEIVEIALASVGAICGTPLGLTSRNDRTAE